MAAQSPIELDPRGAQLTRPELERLLEQLETAATSPGYSGRVRDQARQEAEVVRSRLEEGDFQVGDRVVLRVVGEPSLSDTVTVDPGRVLNLPGLGPIPLEGVLRSELRPYIETQLGRYLQDPQVDEASSLVRVAVLGQVGQQGFYIMPAAMLIEDALMLAGGPAPDADLDAAHIVRGDRVIWESAALQEAIIEGRTLDQLSLRAGDRIIVPVDKPGFFEQGVLRTLLVVIPPLSYLAFRILR